MIRIAQEIPDGATIVDCVTPITAQAARAMKADGVNGVLRYITSGTLAGITRGEAGNILDAGLGLHLVTYADRFSVDEALAAATDVGLVEGTTIEADFESWRAPRTRAIEQLNEFATGLVASAWGDCLYVGAIIPTAAEDLGRLAFTRYHHSLSRVPTPTIAGVELGWSLIQFLGDPRDRSVDWHRVIRGGVNVDVNTAQADNRGRRLTWTILADDTLPDLGVIA